MRERSLDRPGRKRTGTDSRVSDAHRSASFDRGMNKTAPARSPATFRQRDPMIGQDEVPTNQRDGITIAGARGGGDTEWKRQGIVWMPGEFGNRLVRDRVGERPAPRPLLPLDPAARHDVW